MSKIISLYILAMSSALSDGLPFFDTSFIFSIFLYFVEILEQEYEADPMLSIDLFLSTATWIIPRL